MPPTPSSHRPRKKRKHESAASGSNGSISLDPESKREKPAFPLVAFFWPARTSISQLVLLPCILMVVGLFRWCTAIWPYSGFQKPPMHGDFEAQRHWMEVTINLPATHWYFHDLEWWGLDYPPLTAYHSWLLGRIGSLINPDWFALYLSRGLDDLDLKVFMRASVIVSEYLIYIPAAVICVRHLARLHNVNPWESSIALTAILMQPATILIDHGHFQYNTVMLGFVLATISQMIAGRPLWSCVFFVASLEFKQMALFYAPAVAAYLAGICIFPRIDAFRFVGIAIVTVASFGMLYLPLLIGTTYDTYRSIPLPSDVIVPPLLAALPFRLSEKAWYYPYVQQVAQSIHRIFPFARGLFEDKVANIWCALHSSGIHKLHDYSPTLLARAALGLTLTSIIPPCSVIFLKPRKELILPALAATAWGFFLCSYQVHEKNVLLPLLPMTMMLATEDGMKPFRRAWVGFANMLACFTMFPLLTRDGLAVPYVVLTALWMYLIDLPRIQIIEFSNTKSYLSKAMMAVQCVTVGVMLGWHPAYLLSAPPARYPDLWVVANVCLGAAGFGACYLWCLWVLFDKSGLLQDLGIVEKSVGAEKENQ